MTIRNDRSVKILLGAIAFLLAGNLLVQMNPPGSRAAMAAGIPDSGAQLQAQIDQLTEINKNVQKLQALLESGNVTVKVKDMKTDK